MKRITSAILLAAWVGACSVEELPEGGQSTGGTAGSIATGGASGSGAASGSGGVAGAAATGGSAGSAGTGSGGTGGGGTGGSAGGSTCQTGFGDCDTNPNNGCEQELTSSSLHCGACGHDCLGGACQSGKCDAVVVFSGITDPQFKAPWGVAVDDNYIFVTVTAYTSSGYVLRVDKDGKNPTPLASTEGEPFDIALDADNVYWTNNVTGTGSVRKVAKTGGQVSVLAAAQSKPVGISLDAGHVYWANVTSGEVRKVPKTGGTIVDLATQQPSPRATRVDNGFLYWAVVQESRIKRVPLTGGASTIVSNGVTPRDLAVDPNQDALFFSSFQTDGGLYTAAKTASGAQPDVLVPNLDSPMYVHLDDNWLYFATHVTGTGIVGRTAKSGPAEPLILASDLITPAGIATDQSYVYFVEYDANRLVKVAK